MFILFILCNFAIFCMFILSLQGNTSQLDFLEGKGRKGVGGGRGGKEGYIEGGRDIR